MVRFTVRAKQALNRTELNLPITKGANKAPVHAETGRGQGERRRGPALALFRSTERGRRAKGGGGRTFCVPPYNRRGGVARTSCGGGRSGHVVGGGKEGARATRQEGHANTQFACPSPSVHPRSHAALHKGVEAKRGWEEGLVFLFFPRVVYMLSSFVFIYFDRVLL